MVNLAVHSLWSVPWNIAPLEGNIEKVKFRYSTIWNNKLQYTLHRTQHTTAHCTLHCIAHCTLQCTVTAGTRWTSVCLVTALGCGRGRAWWTKGTNWGQIWHCWRTNIPLLKKQIYHNWRKNIAPLRTYITLLYLLNVSTIPTSGCVKFSWRV